MIGVASHVNKVDGILGELDIIFLAQLCIWRGVNLIEIEIGVVHGKLHPNEFYARCSAGICSSILHWKEDGGISGSSGVVDDGTICAMP